jgi:spoIIIJ-associated protein
MSVISGDLKKIKETTQKLLDSMKVELKADVSADVNGVKVNLEGKDSAIMIGYHGENLSAFAYVLNLIVKKELDKNLSLRVDVAGYLSEKDRKIKAMVAKTIEKVKRSGFPEEIGGLNPYERRIAHMEAEKEGLISESVGFGSDRKIVIKPAK